MLKKRGWFLMRNQIEAKTDCHGYEGHNYQSQNSHYLITLKTTIDIRILNFNLLINILFNGR